MSTKSFRLPKHLSLLLVGEDVLMPGSSKRITINTPRNISLVKEHLLHTASLSSTIIGIIPDTQDPLSQDEIPKNVHPIGTAAIVVQVTGTNWPRPQYTLLAHGLCRFRVERVLQDSPFINAQVTQLGKFPTDPDDFDDNDVADLAAKLRKEALLLINSLNMSSPVVSRMRSLLGRLPDHTLPDVITAIVRSTPDEKLKILDAMDLEERLRRTLPLIMRQLESIKLVKGNDSGRNSEKKNDIEDVIIIGGRSDEHLDKKKKPNRFRIVPMRDARRNEDPEEEDELKALENKINSVGMPDEVLKVAVREMKRLKKLPSALPDHALSRNYLELLTEIPWSNQTDDRLDLEQAKLDLDEDHYSMDKLKRRVLEYLAVRQLQSNVTGNKQNVKGPILCFVGPPGVGKTSVGRSIARTLGRKFHRISLGGVCDQSDIRGHRRTYVGSMPGRIISGLKTVGVKNPVFLLDEVDKLGKGLQGDPGAALLEVLDPEQNHTFVDHYLNVPFDLSSVLFIATANNAAGIPAALKDRMEVIDVPGYSQEEKLTIARRHLLPKQLTAHGLPIEKHDQIDIEVTNDALKNTISFYTREAGVRELDRKLGAVCRAVALNVAKQHGNKPEAKISINIDEAALKDILGPRRFDRESAQLLTRPGVAAGLAWTQTGGEILYVEASRMRSGSDGGVGSGHMTLTGQLGDVMKESAQLAVSWLRSNADVLGIGDGDKSIIEGTDLHLHFPAGAVGKDGPSAGVTIVTALVSLFTGKLVRSDLAMTGEITLRGLVLPVGGIKEKVLAAHRAGMRRVVLPKRNERDVEADIPEGIQKSISIRFAESLEDVLTEAFDTGEDNNFSLITKSTPGADDVKALRCKL